MTPNARTRKRRRYKPLGALFTDLKIHELLTVLTIVAAICVFSFNVGFAKAIRSNLDSAFISTDYLVSVSNVWLLATTFVLSLFYGMTFVYRNTGLIHFYIIRRILILSRKPILLLIIVITIAVLSYYVIPESALRFTEAPVSTALGLCSIFVCCGLLVFLISFTHRYRLRPRRWPTVIIQIVIVLTAAFSAGGVAGRADQSDRSQVNSLMLKNGACLERRVVRVLGVGYLLYSPDLSTYEIRERSEVTAIFSGRRCTP